MIEPEATLTFAAPAPDQFVLGDLQMIPITGIVQYHFNPEGRFDFHIGAGVAYVLFDELNDGDDLDDLEMETIDFEDGHAQYFVWPSWRAYVSARFEARESLPRAVGVFLPRFSFPKSHGLF